MQRNVIQLREVGKSFARVRAVDGISFDVREQQIFALLGPNGVGKSTLVRMILGIIPPDNMTYTVAAWEFGRNFKLKDQIIGLFSLLLDAILSYAAVHWQIGNEYRASA